MGIQRVGHDLGTKQQPIDIYDYSDVTVESREWMHKSVREEGTPGQHQCEQSRVYREDRKENENK